MQSPRLKATNVRPMPRPQPVRAARRAPAAKTREKADENLDFYALRQQRIREEAQTASAVRENAERERDLKIAPDENERFERLVGKPKKSCAPCHYGLLAFTLTLVLFSIPMIYSASTAIALDVRGTTDFFLKRQIMFVAIGLLAMFGVSKLRGETLRGALWVLYGACFLGLLAVKFSPLGLTQGNAERWLHLGPVQIQVSEFAKIALIGIMADFWSRAARGIKKTPALWMACALFALPIMGLVFIQPHFSAFALMTVLVLAIALYAGAPLKHFGVIFGVLALVGILAFPLAKPYQRERITAHFSGHTKADARGEDYQSLQGQRAIARGGWFGMGPGASVYKQGHLPAPHTDFILAVIGEEFGVLGMTILLGCFGALVFFCFQTAHSAATLFESLLCAGVGTLIAVQALGNAGVVTGLAPVTGMPLPFLTYGGSGLIAALMGVGLVLAVSRGAGEEA